MWEQIGVGVAVVACSVVAIALLAKVITVAVAKAKATKRRRVDEPSPARKHVMSKVERDVHRALIAANKKRGIE